MTCIVVIIIVKVIISINVIIIMLYRACELQVIPSRDFILNPPIEKLGFIAFDSWVLSNNEIPSVVYAIRCDEINELNP
jgi:hypothetical protein